MQTAQSHKFQWTAASVLEFWNRLSTIPGIESRYFSLQRGQSVLRYLWENLDLQGATILDLGCGQGHMLRHLIDSGVSCMGLDTSIKSVEVTRGRLSASSLFKGAWHMPDFDRIPLDSGSVDGVLLMETIEHLFEEKIPALLSEIRRIVRPEGFVFITTPNNEDLDANEVACQECGCRFHPVQHLRSYDADKLSGTMRRAGFVQQVCKPVMFLPNIKVYLSQMSRKIDPFCPSCGSNMIRPKKQSILQRLSNIQIHTLAYIGRPNLMATS